MFLSRIDSWIIMNSKKVIIIVVILVLLAILCWPRGQYRIASVENGNTVVLDNGTTVRLIGVYNTAESKEFLDDNFIGVKVALLSDSSAPFNPNHLDGTETVYAYVIQKNDVQCINSSIIRSGLSALNEESYLTDSLKSYRKYYERVKQLN